LTMKPWKKG